MKEPFKVNILTIIIISLLISCGKKDKTKININDNNKSQDSSQFSYPEILKLNNDSLKLRELLKISYNYLKDPQDSLKFIMSNQQANSLAIELNDSLGIAATFWDLGEFYHRNSIEDSAYYYYYHAQKIYQNQNRDFSDARLLLNMAIIQKNIRDYTGSEINTLKAIEKFIILKKYKQLYAAYNNLGIIYNELEEYENSAYYYQKAENFLIKSDLQEKLPSLWNNVGVMHHNSKNFYKADLYYTKALEQNPKLNIEDPKLFAMLLDNKAFNLFKSSSKQYNSEIILKKLKESLQIRESNQLLSGIIINRIHLAEYYYAHNDIIRAKNEVQKAYKLALEIKSYRDVLKALRLMASFTESKRSVFDKEYIILNDSLQRQEKAIRNKFTRIRFETEQYQNKVEDLNQKVYTIIIIFIGVVIIGGLLFALKLQNSRLKLVKQKDEANKEIYELLIAQQKKFEEGREKEKQYISSELHDGILSKLFGIRLSLDSLSEKVENNNKNLYNRLLVDIQDTAEEIRELSHRLRKSSHENINLETLMEEFIAEISKTGIEISLDIEDGIDWNIIENEVKINFLRIIQEAIMNTVKHASASQVFVNISKIKPQFLRLCIVDNGKGFSKTTKTNIGIGLDNIKHRTQKIKGVLQIISSQEKVSGTTIIVKVKIPK